MARVKEGDRVQVKADTDSVFAGRRGVVEVRARGGYVVRFRALRAALYFRTDELEPLPSTADDARRRPARP
jgi:hypothetical protein